MQYGGDERGSRVKWKGEPSGDLSGFLDHGTVFKGELKFEETLRIDGKFEGSIRSGKSLIIGESAEVDAEIEVESLYVGGRLRGNATVSVRTELSHSARVQADLTTAILVVEEGAIFEGRCAMQKDKFSGPREVKGEPKPDLKKIVSS
jgi:cytoskeletal protein CcmA (bactofilin family)